METISISDGPFDFSLWHDDDGVLRDPDELLTQLRFAFAGNVEGWNGQNSKGVNGVELQHLLQQGMFSDLTDLEIEGCFDDIGFGTVSVKVLVDVIGWLPSNQFKRLELGQSVFLAGTPAHWAEFAQAIQTKMTGLENVTCCCGVVIDEGHSANALDPLLVALSTLPVQKVGFLGSMSMHVLNHASAAGTSALFSSNQLAAVDISFVAGVELSTSLINATFGEGVHLRLSEIIHLSTNRPCGSAFAPFLSTNSSIKSLGCHSEYLRHMPEWHAGETAANLMAMFAALAGSEVKKFVFNADVSLIGSRNVDNVVELFKNNTHLLTFYWFQTVNFTPCKVGRRIESAAKICAALNAAGKGRLEGDSPPKREWLEVLIRATKNEGVIARTEEHIFDCVFTLLSTYPAVWSKVSAEEELCFLRSQNRSMKRDFTCLMAENQGLQHAKANLQYQVNALAAANQALVAANQHHLNALGAANQALSAPNVDE